jgi:hypothetical protein
MLDELATTYDTTPAALTERMVVATRLLTDHIPSPRSGTITIFWLPKSEQWPNYLDAVELPAREVIPSVRA